MKREVRSSLVDNWARPQPFHEVLEKYDVDHRYGKSVENYALIALQSVPVTSNTPSEGSGDTGDELANARKTKKRRSIKSKKKKASIDEGALVISPPWSDSDLTASLLRE